MLSVHFRSRAQIKAGPGHRSKLHCCVASILFPTSRPPLFIRLTAKSTHGLNVRNKLQRLWFAPHPFPPTETAPTSHRPPLRGPYPAQEVVLKQRLLQHWGHLLQAQHVAEVGEFLLSQGPGARRVKTVKQLLESGLMLVLLCLIHPIARSAHLHGTETRPDHGSAGVLPPLTRCPHTCQSLGNAGCVLGPLFWSIGALWGSAGEGGNTAHLPVKPLGLQARPGELPHTLTPGAYPRGWVLAGSPEGRSLLGRKASFSPAQPQAGSQCVKRKTECGQDSEKVKSHSCHPVLPNEVTVSDSRAPCDTASSRRPARCCHLPNCFSPSSLAAPLCSQTGGLQQRGTGWSCLIQNRPCLHETKCLLHEFLKNGNSINFTAAITWGVTGRVFPEACFSPREL